MRYCVLPAIAISLSVCMVARSPALAAPPVYDVSIDELQLAMNSGSLTSEKLVQIYLDRIAANDRRGPKLNSIIALNPDALRDARKLDAERRAGKMRGPLHGIPVLVKDSIETAGAMATTAGSLALKDNVTNRDAPVIKRLRDAGAIILGKANLTEWSNMRSGNSINGWSAMGGLTRNPYALDRTTCGSSGGSAVAVSAGLAAATLGVETDGSITCPAAMNGVVGLKPTVGLLSRSRIVPISHSQDTPGPMTRTVSDAAILLAVMAGTDPLDKATDEADQRKTDYRAALRADALRGVRLGVLRGSQGQLRRKDRLFEESLDVLRRAGATLVEIEMPNVDTMRAAEYAVFASEFRAGIEAYLAATPATVKVRSLTELIQFNRESSRETVLFGQDSLEDAIKAPPLEDPSYVTARDHALLLAREQGLDRMMREAAVEAIVAAGAGPAGMADPVNGARSGGYPSALPAVAGYPHLTVPMGYLAGLPVGLSFIGPRWSEARLLSFGYAFEQKIQVRKAPQFLPTVNVQPTIADALDPPPVKP